MGSGSGSGDDGYGAVQSWAFICFAAIAYAECHGVDKNNGKSKTVSPTMDMDVDMQSPGNSRSTTPAPFSSSFPEADRDREQDHRISTSTWDPIWTHAMRRANVPAVCRAACHTAYTLLIFSRSSSLHHSRSAHSRTRPLLTSQRVLVEIETLAKDLDVQGPAYPHDSVCVVLAECLKVASQDARLYRMQLEEKVLSWFVECWRVGIDGLGSRGGNSNTNGGGAKGGENRMPLHSVNDILLLLESICGLSKRSDLVCRVLLPECPIVEVMGEVVQTQVIRNFLLHATLPEFKKPETGIQGEEGDNYSYEGSANGRDLVQPRGSERRISAFMLKYLEALSSDWEAVRDAGGHPVAEKARRYIDMAVVALSFESALVLNGTQSTRRVVQCACKTIGLVSSLLVGDSRWSLEEKALVVLGLEPLTSIGEEEEKYTGERWETLLPPDVGTGIKKEKLKALMADVESSLRSVKARRRAFQKIIWQSADVSFHLFRVATCPVINENIGPRFVG